MAARWTTVVLSLAAVPAMQQTGVCARFAVGQAFPNIELPALHDGRRASIEQFRGHKLILHIFASW